MTPLPDQLALHLELARELLGRGLTWRYREGSASMWPTIRPGDEVEIGPLGADEPRPGQILALTRPEGLLVHRLIRLVHSSAHCWLLLRGDARSYLDPPQPVTRLLGLVCAVYRQGQRIEPSTRLPTLDRLRRLLRRAKWPGRRWWP